MVTDYAIREIAKAIRFVGLCLFYGLALKSSDNPQRAIDTVEREYPKQ